MNESFTFQAFGYTARGYRNKNLYHKTPSEVKLILLEKLLKKGSTDIIELQSISETYGYDLYINDKKENEGILKIIWKFLW